LDAPTTSSSTSAAAVPSSARHGAMTEREVPTSRAIAALNADPLQGSTLSGARYQSALLMSALSRSSALENQNVSSGAGVNDQAHASPRTSATKGVQGTAKSTIPVVHGATPEPLVELTHVLNMVHPNNNRSSLLTANAAVTSKPKPPSVASELLVSSALRLAWPPDRRKGVDLSVAAGSCREAAAMLEEAAEYLRLTAGNLDSGNIQVNELTAKTGAGSESKRRRTFGGPSPARANSPPAGTANGPNTTRGSPPVCRGIRV